MNTNMQIPSVTTLVTPWATAVPTPPAPPQTSVGPQDVAVLNGSGSAAAAAEPARSGKGRWIALGALGLVALGVGASLVPGPQGAPVTQATTTTTHASEALPEGDCSCPEDVVLLSLQKVELGVTPVARPFGPSAQGFQIENTTTREAKGDLSLTFNQSTLKGPDGKPLFAPDGMGWVTETFRNEARESWRVESTMEPAGSVGRFVSVRVSEGGYTGFQTGKSDVDYRTLDRSTGRQVNLEEIIEPADFEKVMQTVTQELSSRPDGQRWLHDADQMREFVGSGFSLHQENGKTLLTVTVPPVYDFDTGKVAQVVFEMPSVVLD